MYAILVPAHRDHCGTYLTISQHMWETFFYSKINNSLIALGATDSFPKHLNENNI